MDRAMLVAPIRPAGPIPAEALFPSWRGREPYAERLETVGSALFEAHPGLPEAIAALRFDRFEAACDVGTQVHKYNDVPAAAAAMVEALAEELRAPWLCALMLHHIGRFEEAFAASRLD